MLMVSAAKASYYPWNTLKTLERGGTGSVSFSDRLLQGGDRRVAAQGP